MIYDENDANEDVSVLSEPRKIQESVPSVQQVRQKKELSSDTINMIRNSIAKNATDIEFAEFIYLCNKYDLDPMNKEIYFIKYGSKATIVTSRDGYLKIAQGFPEYDGMESEVIYEGDVITRRDNGSMKIEYGPEHLNFSKSKIKGAFANVYRKDRTVATSFTASFNDYVKKDSQMWQTYTNAMILKVAEAQALKKAFNISGLVTKEEIGKDNE